MGIGTVELLLILFMAVLLLLLVAGAIVAVVWLIRRAAPGGEGELRILRERYARGELSREEYERMRAELRD